MHVQQKTVRITDWGVGGIQPAAQRLGAAKEPFHKVRVRALAVQAERLLARAAA